MEFGKKLVKLRKEKGMSQSELAEELGVSRQAVSRWEGGASFPSTENLKCISALYGVSLDDLLSTSLEEQDTAHEKQLKEEKLEQNTQNGIGHFRRNTKELKTTIFFRRVVVFACIIISIAAIILLMTQMAKTKPEIISLEDLRREETFSVSEETFSINW